MKDLSIDQKIYQAIESKKGVDSCGSVIKASCTDTMPTNLFPDEKERGEVLEFIASGDSVYQLITVGNSYSIYKTITKKFGITYPEFLIKVLISSFEEVTSHKYNWTFGEWSGTLELPEDERGPVLIEWDDEAPRFYEDIEEELQLRLHHDKPKF